MTWSRPEPVTETAPPLRGPVLMHQDWLDLTYVHWAVEPERLMPFMPPGVRPDTEAGTSYAGLVAFRMAGAAPARRRAVPWLGTFLETNVRLYSVDEAGRRGVVFLSLDCDRLVVCLAARGTFGVPYRWARLAYERSPGPDGGVRHAYALRSRRPWAQAADCRLAVDVGPPRGSSPLDRFLTARWGLHASRLGRVLYVPNRHQPLQLHRAEIAELRTGGLLASVGLAELEERAPDHLAFSPGVHAEFGLPSSRPVVTEG